MKEVSQNDEVRRKLEEKQFIYYVVGNRRIR
jgi:hypothetical protein